MAQASLLSDELVQQLIAVGEVDVLVGIPTHNNAATIAAVVTAVHRAFARHFPRDRTVLVNADSGSSDGTREIVRDLSVDDADTVTVASSLRTSHRIVTPYHGVPGKGGAIRQIFAAADLLQARAVAVLDADVSSVTPEWIRALLTPVRAHGCDFVAPIYARHPLEGPLVSQLVRPLMRAAYGRRIAEPQAAEFGCSGAFAADCLQQPVWDGPLGQVGIDIWLTGRALSGPFQCGEAALGPRTLSPSSTRPGLAETFGQVVGALFNCLDAQAEAWLPRRDSTALPLIGPPPTPSTEPPAIDADRLLQSFGTNVRDLHAVLETILDRDTLQALDDATRSSPSAPTAPDDPGRHRLPVPVAHHAGVMKRSTSPGAPAAPPGAPAPSSTPTAGRHGIDRDGPRSWRGVRACQTDLVERWTGSSPISHGPDDCKRCQPGGANFVDAIQLPCARADHRQHRPRRLDHRRRAAGVLPALGKRALQRSRPPASRRC